REPERCRLRCRDRRLSPALSSHPPYRPCPLRTSTHTSPAAARSPGTTTIAGWNHCAGVAGAMVNTTATAASTSWAPGWTVVGVEGAPVAFGGAAPATGAATPDCGLRLIDCTPVTV